MSVFLSHPKLQRGLYTNRLTTVGPVTFAGLTDLQGLFLDNNQITAIADSACQGLTSLQYLLVETHAKSCVSVADVGFSSPGS
jgi:Leucine-rich repeat (LRR) protein